MGIFDNVNDDPLLAVTNDLRTLVQKLDSRVKALEKGSTAGASATPAAATANDDDDDDFDLFGDEDEEVS